MNNAILTCSCSQTPKYALESFNIMIGVKENIETPVMYSGERRISTLLEKLDPNTNIYKYVKSLNKNKDKFAYYMEWDDNGDVLRQFNLLTARRVL